MARYSWLNPRSLLSILAASLLVVAVACGGSAPAEPIIVEKEVVKEVIKEVVVEKEVIKEVIKEVVVEKEVVKEVIKEVVVIATSVPVAAGPVIAKITRLRAALSPPIIELALGWRGTTVDANQQVRHFADPILDTDPGAND